MIPELVLNNNMEKLNKGDAEAIKRLREELKNYNMIDFLSQISGLILIPENQSGYFSSNYKYGSIIKAR